MPQFPIDRKLTPPQVEILKDVVDATLASKRRTIVDESEVVELDELVQAGLIEASTTNGKPSFGATWSGRVALQRHLRETAAAETKPDRHPDGKPKRKYVRKKPPQVVEKKKAVLA